jgi:hypothetical protein
MSRTNLGRACLADGQVDRAISLFDATLKDSTATLGDEHPDTLACSNHLADAYQSAGQLEEATAICHRMVLGSPDAARHVAAEACGVPSSRTTGALSAQTSWPATAWLWLPSNHVGHDRCEHCEEHNRYHDVVGTRSSSSAGLARVVLDPDPLPRLG